MVIGVSRAGQFAHFRVVTPNCVSDRFPECSAEKLEVNPQVLLSTSSLMRAAHFKEFGKICSENEVEIDAERTAKSLVDGSIPLPGRALANPIP
jgi:hypothetical protein